MIDLPQAEQDGLDDGDPTVLLNRLTWGERQCLDLVSSGMVSKEIARNLGVSPHTVDARLRVATRKLGARNRFVAAQLVHNLQKKTEKPPDISTSNLIYEDLSLPQNQPVDKVDGSTGEGNDPADLQQDWHLDAQVDPQPVQPEWLKTSHPFAKFFGGENKLSVGRRLMLIMGIAIGTAMAFTAVVNSLIGLSHLLSSP